MSKAYVFEKFMLHYLDETSCSGDVSTCIGDVEKLFPGGFSFELHEDVSDLIGRSESAHEDYGFRLGFRAAMSLLIGCMGDS